MFTSPIPSGIVRLRASLLLALALIACLVLSLTGPAAARPAAGQSAAGSREPITVFAAASLTEALEAAGRAWTARSGQPVRFSFASSGVIARQISGGARADVFVSADERWMRELMAQDRLVAGSRRVIARGRLVLIAPRASTLRLPIRRGFPLLAALGPRGRLAIGDPAYVPAGTYAREALTSLGVWSAVSDRTLPADNVRVALTYVSRGEAPLGIVYETDAAIDPGVRIIGTFPASTHAPIVYPAALVRGARPGSAAFLAFLRSAQGRAILRRYRFIA